MGGDPLLKMTFHVVDDEGKPVEGAKAGFGGAGRPRNADTEGKGAGVDGFTDAQGIFSGEVRVWDATHSGYEVSKQGHYTAWASFSARPAVWGKWQPWNPTIEVVLKRIRNPVPMYAKRVEASLPKLGEPVGYDLMIGDWVAPHGKGKIPDMFFIGKHRKGGDRDFDWELTVTFANSSDGIQRFTPDRNTPSFRSPYEAPMDGYLSEWILKRSRRGPTEREQTTFDNKLGYLFRVRTVLDKDGKVAKALYGKIYGDFFNMTYYLNPDGTRNIEFDPKLNLLRPAVVNNNNRATYEVGP